MSHFEIPNSKGDAPSFGERVIAAQVASPSESTAVQQRKARNAAQLRRRTIFRRIVLFTVLSFALSLLFGHINALTIGVIVLQIAALISLILLIVDEWRQEASRGL